MEIQSLKVLLTDADLDAVLARLPPDADKIQNLQARLTPGGVVLRGEYPTGFGFKVPFETRWQLTAAGAGLRVDLAEIQVAGMPAGLLRGALMRMIRDATEGASGLSMDGETLLIDLARAAAAEGIDLRVNLTAVRLGPGTAALEAG